MLKEFVFSISVEDATVGMVAESLDEAREKLEAAGYSYSSYLLTTLPVYVCKRCGEVYTEDDLRELREMREPYSKEPFLCPDCYDEYQRLDSEDQIKYLVEGRYDW